MSQLGLTVLVIICGLTTLVKSQDFLTNLISGVPEGVPDVDYPIYTSVPRRTGFSCRDRKPGFYADPKTRCQVWHWCDTFLIKHSFLCPNLTVFNQKIRGCDWWYNVDCNLATSLYSNNDELYQQTPVENKWESEKVKIKPEEQQQEGTIGQNQQQVSQFESQNDVGSSAASSFGLNDGLAFGTTLRPVVDFSVTTTPFPTTTRIVTTTRAPIVTAVPSVVTSTPPRAVPTPPPRFFPPIPNAIPIFNFPTVPPQPRTTTTTTLPPQPVVHNQPQRVDQVGAPVVDQVGASVARSNLSPDTSLASSIDASQQQPAPANAVVPINLRRRPTRIRLLIPTFPPTPVPTTLPPLASSSIIAVHSTNNNFQHQPANQENAISVGSNFVADPQQLGTQVAVEAVTDENESIRTTLNVESHRLTPSSSRPQDTSDNLVDAAVSAPASFQAFSPQVFTSTIPPPRPPPVNVFPAITVTAGTTQPPPPPVNVFPAITVNAGTTQPPPPPPQHQHNQVVTFRPLFHTIPTTTATPTTTTERIIPTTVTSTLIDKVTEPFNFAVGFGSRIDGQASNHVIGQTLLPDGGHSQSPQVSDNTVSESSSSESQRHRKFIDGTSSSRNVPTFPPFTTSRPKPKLITTVTHPTTTSIIFSRRRGHSTFNNIVSTTATTSEPPSTTTSNEVDSTQRRTFPSFPITTFKPSKTSAGLDSGFGQRDSSSPAAASNEVNESQPPTDQTTLSG